MVPTHHLAPPLLDRDRPCHGTIMARRLRQGHALRCEELPGERRVEPEVGEGRWSLGSDPRAGRGGVGGIELDRIGRATGRSAHVLAAPGADLWEVPSWLRERPIEVVLVSTDTNSRRAA